MEPGERPDPPQRRGAAVLEVLAYVAAAVILTAVFYGVARVIGAYWL